MYSLAPVVQEAWEHRRRRRTVALAAFASVVTVGVGAGLASLGSGSPSSSSSPQRVIAVTPSSVLSRTPYMGVNCPVANSIACDRVGLAVWLKHPALSVTATIAGARLSLDYRGDLLYRGDGPRTAFDGFLQPAGIASRLHVRPVRGSVVYTTHGHVHIAMRRRMWFGDVADWPPPIPIRLTIHTPGGRTLLTRADVDLATGWG